MMKSEEIIEKREKTEINTNRKGDARFPIHHTLYQTQAQRFGSLGTQEIFKNTVPQSF